MAEQSRGFEGVGDAIGRLEERMAQRFAAIEQRFQAIDRQFEAIDRRFEAVDRRFDAIDRRFEVVDRRLEAIDQKISRQFVWLVGIQATTLAAVVTAFARAVTVLAGR